MPTQKPVPEISRKIVGDIDLDIFSVYDARGKIKENPPTIGSVIDYLKQFDLDFELEATAGYDGLEQVIIHDVTRESKEDYEKRLAQWHLEQDEAKERSAQLKAAKEEAERLVIEKEEKKLLRKLKKKYEQK